MQLLPRLNLSLMTQPSRCMTMMALFTINKHLTCQHIPQCPSNFPPSHLLLCKFLTCCSTTYLFTPFFFRECHPIVCVNSKTSVNLLYFNVRSLLPKLDHLRVTCSVFSPDIVCIVESWLDDTISDNEIFVQGYIFHCQVGPLQAWRWCPNLCKCCCVVHLFSIV